MGQIITSGFESHTLSDGIKRPLLISSSGGGGHISAINGIKAYLLTIYGKKIAFVEHFPTPPQRYLKDTKDIAGSHIQTFLSWLHEKGVVSDIIRTLAKVTPIPILPKREEIQAEIDNLITRNNTKISRHYTDILLDACPSGYHSAAIANVLAQKDHVNELRKLIPYQAQADTSNHKAIYQFTLNKLKQAANSGRPYTEIISTQAMGIPAICEAIREYNDSLKMQKKDYATYPIISLHQYMTDLPSSGAVHYHKSLNRLKASDKAQIKLYASGLTIDFLEHHIKNHQDFGGLYDIPTHKNPMIRPGFTNPETTLHEKFSKDNLLYYLDYKYHENALKKLESASSVYIKREAKVASIMLGSQASDDIIKYMKAFVVADYEYIFIFGGLKKRIAKEIDAFIEDIDDPTKKSMLKKCIIRLGDQTDKEMQPIFTRSNMLVIRGEG